MTPWKHFKKICLTSRENWGQRRPLGQKMRIRSNEKNLHVNFLKENHLLFWPFDQGIKANIQQQLWFRFSLLDVPLSKNGVTTVHLSFSQLFWKIFISCEIIKCTAITPFCLNGTPFYENRNHSCCWPSEITLFLPFQCS